MQAVEATFAVPVIPPPAPKKSHKKRIRAYEPDNYPPSRRAREDRSAVQANGAKPITCSKCGYVGGNARGCGTAHETVNASTSPAGNDAAAAARPAAGTRVPPATSPSKPTPQRRSAIAALAARRAAVPRAHVDPDDDTTLEERVADAEANKREGVRPTRNSSWSVDNGEVRELDFEDRG